MKVFFYLLMTTALLIHQKYVCGNESMDTILQNENMTSVVGWNENACAWDELMGEGSDFQLQIVDQALLKLLPKIEKGTRILEIACGNGFLARRFAKEGAEVYAIDSSSGLIEHAKKRTPVDLNKSLSFHVADATKEETYDKIERTFDCIICNMALMDISEIKTLFAGASQLLNPEGSFIVTQTHPCFEKAVGPLFHESEEGNGTTTHIHGVKVYRYLNSSSLRVKAVPTLPNEHLFFHRSLSNIFQTAFQVGLVVNGLEEIAFPKSDSISEHNGWHLLDDVPVIIGIRFKKS